jgi:hypothetical protein
MKTTITIMMMGLAISAAPLSAQTADERIGAALERAASAGVPAGLLESKLAEGKAKGVPMDRIAAAMEVRSENLVRAREAMAGAGVRQPSSTELAVAADALEGGVSAAAVAAVSTAAPSERRAVALAVLGELVAEGKLPEEALAQVQAALQRGPDALSNLPAQARAAREGAAGGRPASVPAAGAPTGVGKPPAAGNPGTPPKPPVPPRGGGQGGN